MSNHTNQPASPINHPPLAHDAQGCKIAVPTGTAHWRIQRFTGGRPKLMPGRFDLDLTAEQLLEMCGPGQYRIEALDEYGRPLAEIAKIVVGMSVEAAANELAANPNARAIASMTDSRFMLETLAQMSRAHSESLQSLANAQADWIKTLANAKQIPRNAAMPSQWQLGPPAATEPAEPEPWWAQLLKPQTLAGISNLMRNIAPWFGFKPAPDEPKRRNASTSALAQIAERTATAKDSASQASEDDKAKQATYERAYEMWFGKKPPDATSANDQGKPSTEKSS